MKQFKKALSLLLCIVMMAGVLPLTAFAAADSWENAEAVPFGTKITGKITDSNRKDYYKIILEESGTITVKVKAFIHNAYHFLLDENGNGMDNHTLCWASDGVYEDSWSYSLVRGTYYWQVSQYSGTGNYSITVDFESCNESFAEGNGEFNNSPESASSIRFGQEYRGQLAWNDKADYYKFELTESGTITVKVKAFIHNAYHFLLDENGNGMDNHTLCWASDGVYEDSWSYSLVRGTYYWQVSQYSGTGNYSITVDFESCNESFAEGNGEFNNSPESASSIRFGQEYRGQLAWNDKADYYKFELTESGTITVKVKAFIHNAYHFLLDENGKEMDPHTLCWASDGVYEDSWSYSLVRGTYYWQVSQYSGTGNYSITVDFESCNESFAEGNGEFNNSLESASSIRFGQEYRGQLAWNDKKDYYKFELTESGTITVKVKAFIHNAYHFLLDENGKEMDPHTLCWASDGVYEDSWSYSLMRGTYYWEVSQYSGTGNYSFTVDFESSNETIPESQSKTYNTREEAPVIIIGKEYVGQIACNDKVDLYKLDIDAERSFTIRELLGVPENRFTVIDYAGNTVRRDDDGYYTLRSGIYYLQVNKNNDVRGNYAFFLYNLGDPDHDGTVSAADARMALRMAVGLEPNEENTPSFAAADYNKNGKIQPDDARSILRVSVGLDP